MAKLDLIYTDSSGEELGYIINATSDIDIGDTNDFEIKVGIRNNILDYNYRWFVEDTEYGGIVTSRKVDTAANKIYFGGKTWRGMLDDKVIRPLAGDDYYVVTGNFSDIITELLEYVGLDDLFEYDYDIEDVEIGTFQFDRYCSLLGGINKMLSSLGLRLNVRYNGKVKVSAVEVVDYSDEYEFSSDNNVLFKITDNRGFLNHLICLGSGELSERTVVDLYLLEDGSISQQDQYYTGLEERVEVYDYPNAESETDLVEKGTEAFQNKIEQAKIDVTVKDIDVELGDIISGREYITGTVVQREITDKIVQIDTTGTRSISYKVGD